MFYIVETLTQLDKLSVYCEEESFVQVIPVSEYVHLSLNSPSLVYYRPLTAKHGFILAINHTETLSLDPDAVIGFLNSLEAQIWTIDKKQALYFGIEEKLLNGLKMAYTLSDKIMDGKFETAAHHFYDRLLKKRDDSNRFIPVSKHYERYENMFETLDFNLQPDGFEFYNTTMINSFFHIERDGMKIDPVMFDQYHPGYLKSRSIEDNRIYSSYNLYNLTARPSCKFNLFNFLGMDKTNGARKVIVPANDFFIEFDYKSYQVKLLADLIEYPFTGNIHEQLAKQYFNTDTVSLEQYDEAKRLTFRYTYGRDDNPPQIDFFKLVYALRERLWSFFEENGYIISPISGRKIFGTSNKTQILPYLMQCIETEQNAITIDKLFKLLSEYNTKLILYCYDSFLFDVSEDDGRKVLGKIRYILEDNECQTSVSYGLNYDEMKPITL